MSLFACCLTAPQVRSEEDAGNDAVLDGTVRRVVLRFHSWRKSYTLKI
jgi:hypothetical protein